MKLLWWNGVCRRWENIGNSILPEGPFAKDLATWANLGFFIYIEDSWYKKQETKIE